MYIDVEFTTTIATIVSQQTLTATTLDCIFVHVFPFHPLYASLFYMLIYLMNIFTVSLFIVCIKCNHGNV